MKQNSSFGDHVPTAGCAGRLEVLDGPTGRRVRSEADRARIAAESLMPEVQVAAVARKHGATRRLAASPSSGTTGTARKHGADVRAADGGRMVGASAEATEIGASARVEIVIDDMVIRTTVDLEQLSQVIRAVRASR